MPSAWVLPPVDSLRLRENDSPWPLSLLGNAALRVQADRRLDLARCLRGGFPPGTGGAAELSHALAGLLEEEELAARLILYLPFELLPDLKRNDGSGAVREANERLGKVVVRRWHELLAVSDVRANFVDGDIAEEEPPSRVVKAAHLLPALMARNLVSRPDVEALIERAQGDDVLLDSLADALPGALPPRERRERAIEPAEATPARRAWQERRRAEDAERARAEDLAAEILRAASLPDGLRSLLETRADAVAVTTARLVLERLAAEDLSRARAAHAPCAPLLQQIWRSGGAPDALISLWSRLEALQVIADPPWDRLGLSRPRLDRTCFGDPDLHRLVHRQLGPLLDSPLIYPAGIFFGSRLKGYATTDADLDLAVFVRPGVTAVELPPKTVEIWIDEHGGELRVRDFPDPDASQAGSDWVHVLFGGAWYGDRATIEMLHARLLAPYLCSRAIAADGRPARAHWLEALERDILQYRLMHRGYARFCPPRGGIPATPSPAGLDPASLFWDDGYRRLATLLSLERVFLPSLVEP